MNETTKTAAVHWVNGSLRDKIGIAERFRDHVSSLLDASPDDEDLGCLHHVAVDYHTELVRMRKYELADERRFYELRTSQMLAAVLIEELLDSHADDLHGWFYGCDEGDNMLWLTANVLTDALQQFTRTLEYGRRLNFQPLTDAELAAIQRLL